MSHLPCCSVEVQRMVCRLGCCPRHLRVVQNYEVWFLPVSLGHGSLVVMVTYSWPTCHEFEPSAAENPADSPHGKRFEVQTFSLGVVCKLGEADAS
ncbi:hypothetical protein TNCV_4450871 [Trichonephila clavipes]|nr:hypothetical protein TNCV_4450871 [Trichonephila clavipes]